MPKKYSDINDCIIQGIKDQCSQIQVRDDIIDDKTNNHAFKCAKNSREIVVYNAQLHDNGLTNTSILVSCLDKWIHDQKTQHIVMNNVQYEIDKECTNVVDDSNSELDCATTPSVTLAEGFAIGFGIISAILIAIIAVLIGGILW